MSVEQPTVEQPVVMLVKLNGMGGVKPRGPAKATRVLIPSGATVQLISELPGKVRCWTGNSSDPMDKECLFVQQGKPATLCSANMTSLNVGDEFIVRGIRFELDDPKAFEAMGFTYE